MKIVPTLSILACVFVLYVPGGAIAQGMTGDHRFSGSASRPVSPAAVMLGLKPAEELPAVGQAFEDLEVFHLAKGYGAPQRVDAMHGSLVPPDALKDKGILVDFGSRSLNTVVAGLLVNAGYRVVEDPAAAALVFRGHAQYFSQAIPFNPKRFVLDKRIDDARLDDVRDNLTEGGLRPLSASVFELGLAKAVNLRDPFTLGTMLLGMVMQHTGLAAGVANTPIGSPETLEEKWLLADCYEKASRKVGWCVSEGQKLESYLRKIRVEAVYIQAFLSPPGASNLEAQSTQIIARRQGARTDSEIHLQLLLSAAVGKLMAGFQPVVDQNNQKSAEVKP